MRLLDGCSEGEVPDVCDAIGVAEVMLGLPGFRVLETLEGGDELVLCVETLPEPVACRGARGWG